MHRRLCSNKAAIASASLQAFSTRKSIVPSDHFVSHKQGRIFAREWVPDCDSNKMEPFILFHDSLGCVELWRELPEQLSQSTGRRVIAYDRLGFGLSDKRAEVMPLTFIQDEASSFLPSILDHFKVNKFMVFGHSVGGGMAIHCASRYQDQCLALITESAQTFLEDLTIQGIVDAKRGFQDAKQLQRLIKYHGDKATWVLDSWTESWLHPSFATWSLHETLSTVRCPALAIHGDKDEFGSRKHPEMIKDRVRGHVEMIMMENCGHVPHRENANDVLRVINRFLSNVAKLPKTAF